MAAIAPRFADPATERAFLSAEREKRGRAIRALIVIAIATLLGYIVINPLHFPPEGVKAYVRAAGGLIVLMVGFWLLTRTRFYLEQPWIDLPAFVAMGAAMWWVTLVLAGLSATTGFPPHVMAMIQMGMLMVFASIGFAGTFRLFVAWSVLLLGLFGWWLVTRADVAEISRVYALTNFSTFFIFGLYFNWDIERRAREVFTANLALDAEKAKTEALLYNVLPRRRSGSMDRPRGNRRSRRCGYRSPP